MSAATCRASRSTTVSPVAAMISRRCLRCVTGSVAGPSFASGSRHVSLAPDLQRPHKSRRALGLIAEARAKARSGNGWPDLA